MILKGFSNLINSVVSTHATATPLHSSCHRNPHLHQSPRDLFATSLAQSPSARRLRTLTSLCSKLQGTLVIPRLSSSPCQEIPKGSLDAKSRPRNCISKIQCWLQEAWSSTCCFAGRSDALQAPGAPQGTAARHQDLAALTSS